MHWGVIKPSESVQTRLRLDLGLRRAILGLNEWTVPGAGGVFFVRQLSWACMGLSLARDAESPCTPAQVAEALEAFAGWLVVRRGAHADAEPRIQGKRKFADRKSLSFFDVIQRGAYVTVPFRRSATRALPGLNLCVREEARFSALELTPTGVELANAAFASGFEKGAEPRAWLQRWIDAGDQRPQKVEDSIKRTLEPSFTSKQEKQIVLQRIHADIRRENLAQLLASFDNDTLATLHGREGFLAGLRHDEHRDQLRVCFAFEDVREAALQAAQAVSDSIQVAATSASELALHNIVSDCFFRLGKTCVALERVLLPATPREAQVFCSEQLPGVALEDRILKLITRVPMIFSISDRRVDHAIGYDPTKELLADSAYDQLESEDAPIRGVPSPLLRFRRLLSDCGAFH